MRPTYLALVLLIWAAARCSHTKSVARQDPEPPAQGDAQGEESKADQKPVRDKAPRVRKDESSENNRKDESSENNDEPPLATSPSGLLLPGAAAALQDKLIKRGHLPRSARSEKLDGKTRKALREFQREHGMPATGAPDDLTVEKLGLSPREVFRSAGDAQP